MTQQRRAIAPASRLREADPRATSRPPPRRALLMAAGGVLLCAADDPNPDASLWIEEVRIGLFGRSSAIGGGRLRYRGQVYPFSIQGLSAVASGISTIRAQGEVFSLPRLSDFPGTYAELPGGSGSADGAVEVHWLRNAQGVRVRLRSARAGSALRIAEAGLIFSLEG